MNNSRIVALILLLSACGGSSHSIQPTPGGTPAANPQVSRGAALYSDHCARCHGADGHGTRKAPPLVGPGALPLHPRAGSKRMVDFHTAGDVYRWVRKAMPANDPGSLSDADYAAILAFALRANGIAPSGTTLDEAAADALTLHP